MFEIEKTYLVKQIHTNLSEQRSQQILQGYISSSPSPLRIRKIGDTFEITKKLPVKKGDFGIVEEINIPITRYEFAKLWPLVEKSLEKVRYFIPLEGNLIAELDIFQGDLTGLSFVEVEFTSKIQMSSFQPPDWFGRDITQEEFSANVYLAGKTYQEIQAYLT